MNSCAVTEIYESKLETKKQIKKQLSLSIIKNALSNKETDIDFKGLYKRVNATSGINFKNNDIYDYLISINLEYLFPNTEANQVFKCFFIEGNLAWISEQNNHYRYFTKSFNGDVVSLDIIDLAKLYYELDNSIEAIEKLIKSMNITFLNTYWRKTQISKYQSNLYFLENIDKFQSSNFYLYKLIFPHIELLKFLNKLGLKNLLSQKMSYEKDAIFFASSSYIADNIQVSRSKVTKLMNLFSLLDIVKKIPEKQIPTEMLNKSKSIANARNTRDIVNYYSITNILDNIENLERRAKLIDLSPIRYSNINKNIIKEHFGDETANVVYPNK